MIHPLILLCHSKTKPTPPPPHTWKFPIEDPFQQLQLNFSQLQLGSGMDSSLAAKLAHSQARFFCLGSWVWIFLQPSEQWSGYIGNYTTQFLWGLWQTSIKIPIKQRVKWKQECFFRGSSHIICQSLPWIFVGCVCFEVYPIHAQTKYWVVPSSDHTPWDGLWGLGGCK